MWKRALDIVENYIKEHALSAQQRTVFCETCIRKRDEYLAEKSNAIAATFAVEEAIGLAVVFALA